VAQRPPHENQKPTKTNPCLHHVACFFKIVEYFLVTKCSVKNTQRTVSVVKDKNEMKKWVKISSGFMNILMLRPKLLCFMQFMLIFMTKDTDINDCSIILSREHENLNTYCHIINGGGWFYTRARCLF